MATETPYTLSDFFGVLRRRSVWLLTLLPAAMLIAVYLAFTLPRQYVSSATILLEPSSIPADMIKTTVTAFADQQIEIVRGRVMTRESLLRLVQEVDPYPNRDDLNANDKAAAVAANSEIVRVDPITLEPLLVSSAFSVHYRNPDPDLAAAIAKRLAQMFLDYNRETRTQQATETVEFLQAQSTEASQKIVELERRLAEFKAQYGDALPESQERNENMLDRAGRDLQSLEQQLLLAKDRRSTLELQRTQINPNLFDPAGDWRNQLKTLQSDLAVAQKKYSPDHPEVRRLRRAIEAMSARTDTNPTSLAPDNPEYKQVVSQLDTVNREISALQASADRYRDEIRLYERGLKMAPEVERDYAQLLRDYDIAQERFRGIEDRLRDAALGQALETQQRGGRFTLIREPYRPTSPDSPNRLGIILLGLVLGGGLGVGMAALRESSDPSVRSMRDLLEITDIKALAAVPVMRNAADRKRRIVAWSAAGAIAAIAVVFVGITIAQSSS